MIDAVLTYHQNPSTCGVAKWNHALAQRLGVPVAALSTFHAWKHPLVSVKFAEIDELFVYTGHGYGIPGGRHYTLFMHDRPVAAADLAMLNAADTVYAANGRIADAVRDIRPDVISAWCPSTVSGNADRDGFKVLTFGMAHKLAVKHYRNLKMQLDREHPNYLILLSTAVHEGSPWDEALRESAAIMREMFGARLRVLGYLGDDALAKELQDCDAVAVFFDPAVRENNTTVWAALNAGKPVYTNLDEHSPELDPERYGWTRLLDCIRAHDTPHAPVAAR